MQEIKAVPKQVKTKLSKQRNSSIGLENIIIPQAKPKSNAIVKNQDDLEAEQQLDQESTGSC